MSGTAVSAQRQGRLWDSDEDLGRVARLHLFAIAVALSAGWLAPTSAGWLLAALCSAAVCALAYRAPFGTAPAVWIYLGVLMSSLVAGQLLWGWVRDSGGTGADLAWTAQVESAAWNAFCLGILGAALGAHLTFRRRPFTKLVNQFDLSRLNSKMVMFVATVPALLTWASVGPELVRRDTYLFLDSGSLLALASGVLTIPGAAASGWLIARPGPIQLRAFGVLFAVAYILMFFGEASRRLALFPLVLFIGMRLSGAPWAKRRTGLVAASLLSIALLQIPLALRALPDHGISSYSSSLSDVYEFSMEDLKGSLANGLFSYPLAGVVASQQAEAPDVLVKVSLDPRPGGMAGWYEIAPSLRVNVFTPFSGLGELAWISGWVLLAYSVVVGAVLGAVDVTARRSLFLSFIGPPISLLMAVMFLQYNLRTAARMLTFILVCLFIVLLRNRGGGAVASIDRSGSLSEDVRS